MLFARHLGKTAVTASDAPLACNRPFEHGRVVRPDDYLAAVATGQGVGPDCCVSAYDGSLCIRDQRVLTLVIAADEGGATAGVAAHIHQGVAEKTDVIAEQGHLSAFGAGSIATGFEGAGIDYGGWIVRIMSAVHDNGTAGTIGVVRGERAGILDVAAAGAQHDSAALVHDTVGADDAAVVDGQRVNVPAGGFEFRHGGSNLA